MTSPESSPPSRNESFDTLLTGATGLVGIHLLLELVRRGNRIRALKRPGSDVAGVWRCWEHYGGKEEIESWREQVQWVDADLLDEPTMREQLQGIQTVYHTAAMVSFNPRDRKEMLAFNVNSTALLVNLSLELQIPRFAFVSSVSTLGVPLFGEPATEALIGAPDKHASGYALSKFHSENEVWRGIAEGLQAVIVNPSVILGPGNWNRSSSQFFSAISKGLKYYTEGGTGFVDARDVARALVDLVEKECFGERYILSAGELSYRELFEHIARELGRQAPSKKAPAWLLNILWRMEWLRSVLTGSSPLITRELLANSKKFSRFSSEKARAALGYGFHSPEDSIRDTAKLFHQEQET